MGKFDNVHMDCAVRWAEMSYCKRNKVGSVISLKDRTTIPSYNGTISGMENNCEKECVDCKGSGRSYRDEEEYCPTCRGKGLITNDFTLHAEANAITHAANEGISLKGTTIYTTMSPCKDCSKLIAQSGIIKVVYLKAYRNTEGLDFLKSVGVEVEKYYPWGNLLRSFKKVKLYGNNKYIENDWEHFPAGTAVEDIWGWFRTEHNADINEMFEEMYN